MGIIIKNRMWLCLLVTVLLISMQKSTGLLHVQNNSDLFNQIIQKTNSNVEEYGLTTCFETKENGRQLCLNILKKLRFNDSKYNVTNSNNIFCIEFSKNSTSGYIESIRNNNSNVITLQIRQKGSKNNIAGLEDNIRNVLNPYTSNQRYFQYVKAKTNEQNIEIINNNIVKLLKEKGTVNINTVSINNGYSTTAYTNEYLPICSNNNLVDLNYAVCKYSSGNYIIIGTPEILITY